MRRRCIAGSPALPALVLLAGLVFPMGVFGHGVEVYDLTGGEGRPVRTIYFKYSTGEPISFAKIKLFPPSTRGKDVESLVTITDRNGIICFVPDESGEWRVDMEDGMGHKGSINVTAALDGPDAAADAGKGAKTPEGRAPLVFNIALGLSLLANIFGVWFLAGRKKRGASDAHK